MKTLFALLLLFVAPLGAQTVSPSQIKPGANGQVITTQGGKTQWGTNTGGVSSFNTRTGAVTAAAGDYNCSQVSGAICSLPPTPTVYYQLVKASGAAVPPEPILNLITGMLGTVNSVPLTSGGSGYGFAPTITFTGGGCTAEPTATASVASGVVNGIALTFGGSACTSAPTVTFSGGGGLGAAATATLTPQGISCVDNPNGTSTDCTVAGSTGSGTAPTCSYSDVTYSRSANTTYQNTSSGFLYIGGSIGTNGSGVGNIGILEGSTAGTLTLDSWSNQATATVNGGDAGFTAAIYPGFYYRIVSSGAVNGTVRHWIEKTCGAGGSVINAGNVFGVLPTANGGTGEAGTFTGLRKANGASADTQASSSDMQTVIGDGVYAPATGSTAYVQTSPSGGAAQSVSGPLNLGAGSTATTQALGDNSTKVATTRFAYNNFFPLFPSGTTAVWMPANANLQFNLGSNGGFNIGHQGAYGGIVMDGFDHATITSLQGYSLGVNAASSSGSTCIFYVAPYATYNCSGIGGATNYFYVDAAGKSWGWNGTTNKGLCLQDGTYCPSFGTGTVTSVAMTMPGVLFNSTVSGSPITTSGTLAPTLLSQSAYTFFGNGTSSSGTPTFMNAATALAALGSGTSATGSGGVVLATSPTLVAPALGTPASGVITNLTGTCASCTSNAATTATNVAGGVLGSLPYQSATGTTALLAPNTSTTPCVIRETGTGSAGQALVCDNAPAISAANMTKAFVATGSTPTYTLGAGAGSGASISSSPAVSTTGKVGIITGSSPASGSTALTITFSAALPSTPYACLLAPANGSSIVGFYADQLATTGFNIRTSGSFTPSAASEYDFYWHCF